MGGKGGIQYPIVGETDQGEILEVSHVTGKRIKTTALGSDRRTACMLIGADFEMGGPYANPETTDAAIGEFGFVKVGNNVLTWTNGADCLLTFWVF
jgi:hypothetical protein